MIRVCLMKRRKTYECQWKDPVTGKKRTRTTGTASYKDAQRFAGNLERDLNGDGLNEPVRMLWKEFVKKYDEEKLASQSTGGRLKSMIALNAFTRLINPERLGSVGPQQVSQFAQKLRAEKFKERKRKEATICGNLTCVRAALRWAHRQKLIPAVIHVEMPKRPPGMKGRPITAEEFDRMIEKVESVVGKAKRDEYQRMLRGLWWSGLRLGEAMDLHWTDDSRICVDMGGKRPMFFIRGHAEKGRQNRILAMAPQFAEFLQQTPEKKRTGYVFFPDIEPRPAMLAASKTISLIGKAAKVRVSPNKTASAHDLRRAFGFRWSRLVMPAVLQEMMRHANINTTMEFYVGQNAESTADAAWQAVANTSANTDHVHGAIEKR